MRTSAAYGCERAPTVTDTVTDFERDFCEYRTFLKITLGVDGRRFPMLSLQLSEGSQDWQGYPRTGRGQWLERPGVLCAGRSEDVVSIQQGGFHGDIETWSLAGAALSPPRPAPQARNRRAPAARRGDRIYSQIASYPAAPHQQSASHRVERRAASGISRPARARRARYARGGGATAAFPTARSAQRSRYTPDDDRSICYCACECSTA